MLMAVEQSSGRTARWCPELPAGGISLKDRVTGEEIQTFAGHEKMVTTLAFTADGEFALSAGWDGVVILWKLQDGDAVRVFDGHDGYVLGAASTPDLELVLSTGADGTVRLFRLESPDVNELLQKIDAPSG